MKFFILFLILFMLIACGEKEPKDTEIVPQPSKQKENVSAEIGDESSAVIKEANEEQEIEEDRPEAIAETRPKPLPKKTVVQNKAVLWRSYRQVKGDIKKAEATEDYQKQVKLLLQAADLANQLERKDIEAWQYNNVGYALIKDFKQKTDYYKNMAELNNLIYISEIKESRARISSIFSQQQQLLNRAKLYLKRAEKIDSSLEESARTNTIQSNLLFINEVMRFIGEAE